MKRRSKMMLLAVGMFVGLFCSTGLGLCLVSEVRVGGPIYQTIRDYKGLLEQIALLKSDLNQVRSETLILILGRNQDKRKQIRTGLGRESAAVLTAPWQLQPSQQGNFV